MVTIIIPRELMDLNQYIDAQRVNFRVGNKVKQQETAFCAAVFTPYRLEIRQLPLPLDIEYHWFCKDRRKDKDNICFARKFILDGLINSGAIKNDGWNEVGGFSDCFYVDKVNPRVEVVIK